MPRLMLLLCLVLATGGAPAGQGALPVPDSEPGRTERLRTVLPAADLFVRVEEGLPHYRGFRTDAASGAPELVGFVFLTHEVLPYEVAYAGRIDMLAGMTVGGVITGLEVLVHDEPYGYFSIDEPRFPAQFTGKSIMDPLTVGDDIDSVTRATITVEGATGAVRKSARLLARQFLREQQSP